VRSARKSAASSIRWFIAEYRPGTASYRTVIFILGEAILALNGIAGVD